MFRFLMQTTRPNDRRWQELKFGAETSGYLSFYYSDDLSPLPVRWVTKPGDNKSDPNFETATYGLFSTCSPNMRSGVARKQIGTIFFFTRRNGRREVTGFYRVRYHAQGPLG